MNKTKLVDFLFLVLLATMLSCHHQYRPTQVAIIIDRSASTRDMTGSALGLVRLSCALHGISAKSRLVILATGDQSTAMEPIELGNYAIPRSKKVIEGKDANSKYQAELLRRISQMLEGVSATVEVSPIYLAVLRGAQLLKAQGCFAGQKTPNCRLYVVSDLQETQERAVRQALAGAKDFKPEQNLLIDNAGIQVEFCGLAATDGLTPTRDSVRAAKLEAVWKVLFTEPDRVVFEPFCPQPTEGGEK